MRPVIVPESGAGVRGWGAASAEERTRSAGPSVATDVVPARECAGNAVNVVPPCMQTPQQAQTIMATVRAIQAGAAAAALSRAATKSIGWALRLALRWTCTVGLSTLYTRAPHGTGLRTRRHVGRRLSA